jgi:thiol-disulfide isomerase/thioredoxin
MAMKYMFIASSLFLAPTESFQVNNPQRLLRSSAASSKTGISYVPSATEDVPESAKTPAFEEHVKSLIQIQETSSTKALPDITTTPKINPHKKGLPNVSEVSSKQEFRRSILEEPEHKLTVVRFYSPVCKACQAIEQDFERLARVNPDINFIHVAYTKKKANRDLVHALGVPSFPYGHVYLGKEMLEESSVNKKYFKSFSKLVESYHDGGCDLPVDESGNVQTEDPYGLPFRKSW